MWNRGLLCGSMGQKFIKAGSSPARTRIPLTTITNVEGPVTLDLQGISCSLDHDVKDLVNEITQLGLETVLPMPQKNTLNEMVTAWLQGIPQVQNDVALEDQWDHEVHRELNKFQFMSLPSKDYLAIPHDSYSIQSFPTSVSDPESYGEVHVRDSTSSFSLAAAQSSQTSGLGRVFKPLPPFIIRPYDTAGPRKLVANDIGYMYYDPGAPLKDIIQRRGVCVPPDDPILRDRSCFENHAVSVFVEKPMIPGTVTPLNGPKVEYIGDFYLHKTLQTLDKHDWMQVREHIKQKLVGRYMNLNNHPSNDPSAGNCYTPKNVRNWYDAGQVLQLVLLLPTRRPLPLMSRDGNRNGSFLQLNAPSQSEYGNQESQSYSTYQAHLQNLVSCRTAAEAAEFQAARRSLVASMRWNSPMTYWRQHLVFDTFLDDKTDDTPELQSEPDYEMLLRGYWAWLQSRTYCI